MKQPNRSTPTKPPWNSRANRLKPMPWSLPAQNACIAGSGETAKAKIYKYRMMLLT